MLTSTCLRSLQEHNRVGQPRHLPDPPTCSNWGRGRVCGYRIIWACLTKYCATATPIKSVFNKAVQSQVQRYQNHAFYYWTASEVCSQTAEVLSHRVKGRRPSCTLLSQEHQHMHGTQPHPPHLIGESLKTRLAWNCIIYALNKTKVHQTNMCVCR